MKLLAPDSIAMQAANRRSFLRNAAAGAIAALGFTPKALPGISLAKPRAGGGGLRFSIFRIMD